MKKHMTLFVLATFALTQTDFVPCLAVGPGANFGNELFRLTADDAMEDQGFARSVGISGNTAIIGSDADHDAGDFAGSAYLFNATTGQQLSKLFASDAERNDIFGISVAISGDKAIVGAPGKSLGGAAYLFDAATGQQLLKLTPSDAQYNKAFGTSLAISGNTAIVGAPGRASQSAYLFDVTTGQELFKLTSSDVDYDEDLFANSVAISGNVAIVGAHGDSNAGSAAGSAYLFDVTTGQQLFKLTASDASPGGTFGFSVGISGNVAIIGSDSGSAYLFDVTTGQELAQLAAADAVPAAEDRFGFSVAISGNLALVGTEGDMHAGHGAGSAYLFDVTTHEEVAKLVASDAAEGQDFGGSVAISGNRALVGALGATSYGAAYVFSPVPEPTTFALLAVGLALLVRRVARRTSNDAVRGDCRFAPAAATQAVAVASLDQ